MVGLLVRCLIGPDCRVWVVSARLAGWAVEWVSAAGVGEECGLGGFCLFLPEVCLSWRLRPVPGRRVRISVTSVTSVTSVFLVCSSVPGWSMASAGVWSRMPAAVVQSRLAGRGRYLTDGSGDCGGRHGARGPASRVWHRGGGG